MPYELATAFQRQDLLRTLDELRLELAATHVTQTGEMHAGRLWVAPAIGRGSTIGLVLPVHTTTGAA